MNDIVYIVGLIALALMAIGSIVTPILGALARRNVFGRAIGAYARIWRSW